jgi:hypothetical protein
MRRAPGGPARRPAGGVGQPSASEDRAYRRLLDPVAYLDASKNRRRTDEQEIDCNDRGWPTTLLQDDTPAFDKPIAG